MGKFKLVLFGMMLSLAAGAAPNEIASSFFDLSATDIEGKTADMKRFQGKVLLVVNTASKCGYTEQYKGLQALQDKYGANGFTVLGFPSNDFGGQEPGSNGEIKKFCALKYAVTFPMFSKNPVKGNEKQPIYQFLTSTAPAEDSGEVKWNFEKFLISSNGKVVGRFRSSVAPEDFKITSQIEKYLSNKK